MTVSVKVSVPEATELYVYTWLGWNVLCQVMLSQQIRVCVCACAHVRCVWCSPGKATRHKTDGPSRDCNSTQLTSTVN